MLKLHKLTETDEGAGADTLGLTDEDLEVGVGLLEGGVGRLDELPGSSASLCT